MKNVFIVKTENFAAHCLACKALKAIDNGAEMVHNLYKKAAMNAGKIVITSLDELALWKAALEGYKPVNKIEANIHRALLRAAKGGIKNRSEAIVAMCKA